MDQTQKREKAMVRIMQFIIIRKIAIMKMFIFGLALIQMPF